MNGNKIQHGLIDLFDAVSGDVSVSVSLSLSSCACLSFSVCLSLFIILSLFLSVSLFLSLGLSVRLPHTKRRMHLSVYIRRQSPLVHTQPHIVVDDVGVGDVMCVIFGSY